MVNGSADSTDQQSFSNNSKILEKRDCKVSRPRDVPSDSDVQAIGKEENEEIVEDLSEKLDKSLGELKAPKRSLNFEHDSSKERLLNLTKSWTEMQENIKREREVSERELRALERENFGDNRGSDDDDDLENSDRKLLRYFERDRSDDDDGRKGISKDREEISKDKDSLKNLLVLDQPHSADSFKLKNNGYSLADDDDDDNNDNSVNNNCVNEPLLNDNYHCISDTIIVSSQSLDNIVPDTSDDNVKIKKESGKNTIKNWIVNFVSGNGIRSSDVSLRNGGVIGYDIQSERESIV